VIPAPSADPADRVTLDDSVRMALLIMLERLSPAERAAFVLHDVFQYSFEDVGSALGRTPAACRQLASRARRRVSAQSTPARFQVDKSELFRVADHFFTAASSGDLDALLRVLDPNVVGHADSGGVVIAARKPVAGRDVVANALLTFMRVRKTTLVPMPVNSEPGALVYENGRLVGVVAIDIRDGLVVQIHVIVNPAKLAYVSSIVHASPASR
jgi:RNA polymerase sigma-70 factor (ECF subfamily)